MDPKIIEGARIALKECLALKAGEKFLVVTDEPKLEIGRAFFEVGKEMGAEAVIMEMLPRKINGEEPPDMVAQALLACDVFVAPASKSLTHTRARNNATSKGARGATLPGVTADMMARCIGLDYSRLEERCNKLCSALTEGKMVHITTKAGTDLKFSLETRSGAPDTGIYTKPGIFGNLPAGEAYIAPLENTANGILVIDGSMVGSIVDEPIRVKIVDGYATEITGGKNAKELIRQIESVGHLARNVAEFGIGLNEKAIFTGEVLEDEKIDNTIHIAFGNNKHFGGVVDVPFHQDGIVKEPTVEIDGQVIIREGKHLL